MQIKISGKDQQSQRSAKKEIAADKERLLDWTNSFPDTHASELRKRENTVSERKTERLPGRPGIRMFHQSRTSLRMMIHLFRLFWLPISAAIVIGLGLGLSMLILFNGSGQESSSSTWKSTDSAAEANPGGTGSSKSSLQLTIYMMQAGVYSTKGQATKAAANLRSKGMAVLTGGSKSPALFIGAAVNRSGAEKLFNYYKNQGIPVYQKQVRFQPARKALILQDQADSQLAGATHSIILKMAADPQIQDTAIYPEKQSIQSLGQLNERLQSIKIETNSRQTSLLMNSIREIARTGAERGRLSENKRTRAAYASYQESLLELIALYQELIDQTVPPEK